MNKIWFTKYALHIVIEVLKKAVADPVKRDAKTISKKKKRVSPKIVTASVEGQIILVKDEHSSSNICEISFSDKQILSKHKKTHSVKKERVRFQCSQCEKSYTSKKNLTVHERFHSGEIYSCDVCEKIYPFESRLADHKRTHTLEKPFSCEVCQKSFHSTKTLQSHKKTHNPKVKPYYCDICNRAYPTKLVLEDHDRIKHGLLTGYTLGW